MAPTAPGGLWGRPASASQANPGNKAPPCSLSWLVLAGAERRDVWSGSTLPTKEPSTLTHGLPEGRYSALSSQALWEVLGTAREKTAAPPQRMGQLRGPGQGCDVSLLGCLATQAKEAPEISSSKYQTTRCPLLFPSRYLDLGKGSGDRSRKGMVVPGTDLKAD